MEKYYTIHFEDAGTGECFDDSVFTRELDAYSHFDYPGYGHMDIKEIDWDEAVKILKDEINAIVKSLEGEVTEEAWIREAQRYVEDREHGWEVLEEYLWNVNAYCAQIKDRCPYSEPGQHEPECVKSGECPVLDDFCPW